MDAIDILGGLLGAGKSRGGSSSGSGSILKDLINGGRSSSSNSSQSRTPSRSGSDRQMSIEERARELEQTLGVARDRNSGQSPSVQSAPPQSQSRYRQPPPPSRQSSPNRFPNGESSPSSSSPSRFPESRFPDGNVAGNSFPQNNFPGGERSQHEPSLSTNDEALILVRAMINAAKSDGNISEQEQKSIVDRLSNPDQQTINFLRSEFSSPLNVRDFAWSIPLGMEQQVYTMSLAAIDLDNNAEAQYLRDLAHGLRLEPEFCNQLHQQYGVPTIF